MTTSNDQQRAKNALIRQLAGIANSYSSGINGPAKIKAAVMAADLSGLPVPTREDARYALGQLEMEFGIELLTSG